MPSSLTSGGSFLNETGSKQVPSESCRLETLKSKQKQQSESDAKVDLNDFDQAISAIIDEAPFDGDSNI